MSDQVMFPVHGLVPLLAAIASLLLAALVYGKSPDRRVGRVFSILAITLAFWNLNFFALYSLDYANALFWSRVFRTGGLFIVATILHLCLVLPERPIPTGWRLFLVFNYAFAIVLVVANLRGSLVVDLKPYTWGYYSVGDPFYTNAFTIVLLITFACAVGLVIRDYVTTVQPRMRLQLKFWLLGMAVALPLGLTNLLPAYGVHFYPLGNLGSVVWAAIVGYAIARYRLLDVEIAVTKGLSYALVVVVLIAPISACVVVLQEWAFGEVHYDFSVALTIVLASTGIVFPRLQQFLERQFEKRLFRRKFASRAALGALAGELVRLLESQKLIDRLRDGIADALGLSSVAVYLREELRGRYELRASMGDPQPAEYGAESVLVRMLSKSREAMLREEYSGAAPAREGATEWSACVPLVNGRDLLGIVCLGPKPALQAYTAGDLALLNQVGMEAGVALQNARLYGELRRSREMISRAGRLSALGTLAAGIAHEIRNPLVSIQTFFQLAPQRLGDEEFMTSFLRLAEAEVQRISSLVDELLTFAKSPARTLENVDLNDIVERTATLVEPQARTQGVTLKVVCERDLQPMVGDADQLMQVLLNLALNGIQATPSGGVVTIETRNAIYEGSQYAQVEVSDTGSGISDDLRESIFDPFFTTKEKGTGLGLPIAHQIVAESGGFISVESAAGCGARFVISLPAGSVESEGKHWSESTR